MDNINQMLLLTPQKLKGLCLMKCHFIKHRYLFNSVKHSIIQKLVLISFFNPKIDEYWWRAKHNPKHFFNYFFSFSIFKKTKNFRPCSKVVLRPDPYNSIFWMQSQDVYIIFFHTEFFSNNLLFSSHCCLENIFKIVFFLNP